MDRAGGSVCRLGGEGPGHGPQRDGGAVSGGGDGAECAGCWVGRDQGERPVRLLLGHGPQGNGGAVSVRQEGWRVEEAAMTSPAAAGVFPVSAVMVTIC